MFRWLAAAILGSIVAIGGGGPAPDPGSGVGPNAPSLPGGIIVTSTSEVTAAVPMNETTGPSPLHVWFDARAVQTWDSRTDSYKRVRCEWYYDDPGSGNWDNGYDEGLSKNYDSGPCTGTHLFDAPNGDTFTVQMVMTDIDTGQKAATLEAQVTVTPVNATSYPNGVYCVGDDFEPTAGADGCPSTATNLINDGAGDYDRALLTHCDVDGTTDRACYLLNEGTGSWTQDVEIGDMASGGNGYLNLENMGSLTWSNTSHLVHWLNCSDGWRVQVGSSTVTYGALGPAVLECQSGDPREQGMVLDGGNYVNPTHLFTTDGVGGATMNQNIAVLDVTTSGDGGGGGQGGGAPFPFSFNVYFLFGQRFTVRGNYVDHHGWGEYFLRTTGCLDCDFRNNFWHDKNDVRYGWSFRACHGPTSLNGCCSGANQWCQSNDDAFANRLVVMNNHFQAGCPDGDVGNSQRFVLFSQNTQQGGVTAACFEQGLSCDVGDGNDTVDTWFVRNLFEVTDPFSACAVAGWRGNAIFTSRGLSRSIISDNVVDLQAIPASASSFSFFESGWQADGSRVSAREDVDVSRNTVRGLTGQSGKNVDFCWHDPTEAEPTRYNCDNNLYECVDCTNTLDDVHPDTAWASSLNNVIRQPTTAQGDSFAGAWPAVGSVTKDNFTPAPAEGLGGVIDAGDILNFLKYDAFDNCRTDGSPDIGAIEVGASSCVSAP